MSGEQITSDAPSHTAAREKQATRSTRQDAEATQAALSRVQRIRFREILGIVGPGVITGGADNDPAGITTYSVVGAQSGFTQNWLLLLSTPLLIVVQQMAARIGNVTKNDLATLIRIRYGMPIATLAVGATAIANIITIGADLVMMAATLELVTGRSYVEFVVPIAAVAAFSTIFLNYRTMQRYLLWLAAVFACYIVSAFLARPNWIDVAKSTFLPHLSLDATYLLGAVGLLGTTITPYLFFWQTSGEIEDRRGVQDIRRSGLDIIAGMVWSNIVALFILIVTGAVLHAHGKTIVTAADAARALEPFVGSSAKYLFAVGIVGAGLLAVPVLAASTAYAMAGLLGWRRGLARRVNAAPAFYLVLGLALLVGVQLAIAGVDPIKALFYSQVLDGLIAAPLVLLLLLLTTNRAIMGDFVIGRVARVIGWVAVGVLATSALALVYSVATQGLP